MDITWGPWKILPDYYPGLMILTAPYFNQGLNSSGNPFELIYGMMKKDFLPML